MDEKILKRENGKEFSFWHIKLYAFHLYNCTHYVLIKLEKNTSLVVQWLRICLLVQGTRVQSLVWGRSHTSQGQLSLCAPTTEPVLRNKRSHHTEKPAPRLESSSRSPQLKKACVQQETQHSQKKKNWRKIDYQVPIHSKLIQHWYRNGKVSGISLEKYQNIHDNSILTSRKNDLITSAGIIGCSSESKQNYTFYLIPYTKKKKAELVHF